MSEGCNLNFSEIKHIETIRMWNEHMKDLEPNSPFRHAQTQDIDYLLRLIKGAHDKTEKSTG